MFTIVKSTGFLKNGYKNLVPLKKLDLRAKALKK